MSTSTGNFWKRLTRRDVQPPAPIVEIAPAPTAPRPITRSAAEIAPNDPLAAYFVANPGVVELGKLNLDSPALRAMKTAGVHLALPLISQGEMVGLLSLGPRLSEQNYSADDHRLLANLATQAAPALRVAQLAYQQQIEAAERERMEQELKVARVIQQTLLPHKVPDLPGYQLGVYWQPARAVGGDFYDFMPFDDGRMCIIIADVTDKGIPAALVMASARSILRAAGERLKSPGEILRRVNEALVPDIPARMFVTCLCMVLDPQTGVLRYANAGHNPPYQRTADGVISLWATGMPLGLMPGMIYEEQEAVLAPGDTVLLHSDGMGEAHNSAREMFGFPRMEAAIAAHPGGESLINHLLAELSDFTGPGWDQEDDVTFVMLARDLQSPDAPEEKHTGWHTLAEFTLRSEPGNERQAMERVAQIVRQANLLEGERLEQLKTAVAEATMNAMEHGNGYQPHVPALIRVSASETAVAVTITDEGMTEPVVHSEAPDLDAKLAGMQTPRGWGLFLIQKMVDEMNIINDEIGHTIELIVYLPGGMNDSTSI
jgi:serine phosphatase RsbU (regulator of sigma subunit)/anti-sigma regulatory factor (Ser/Thr protein kinase)